MTASTDQQAVVQALCPHPGPPRFESRPAAVSEGRVLAFTTAWCRACGQRVTALPGPGDWTAVDDDGGDW